MHVRGAETQPQLVLDGVPLADTLTGNFASGIDTENLHSTSILTGNIPAEYGERSAVVNLTSKSGLDMPMQGALAVSGGSFTSQAVDVEFGGHTRKFGFFITSDASRSDRFLDPPEIGNYRNLGGVAHLFTRFDWLPTKTDSFRLSLATDGSDMQVPNTAEQQDDGQRQTQRLRDDFQAITWSRVLSARTTFDLSASRRSSSAAFEDPHQTGTPLFIEQHRRQRTEGLRAKINHEWKLGQFQGGAEVYRLPISEAFSLAVTDPEDVIEEPDEPLAAYTLDNPFRFQQQRTGWRTAGFVQQHMSFGERWTIDAGLRFDYRDLILQENAWSPRVGIAYRLPRTGTVFRFAYNRLFQTPPLENLLLSSSTDVAELSDERLADSYRPVPSERQNFYEFGVQQRIGSRRRLDVAHYIKNSSNFLDDGQLLTTPIVFPTALRGADVHGTEVRLDFKATHGISAYVSYANANATIITPLVGGIFLGSEAEDLFVPGRHPADQDERNEVQVGATYAHRSGAWVSFVGRFDSGLPVEFDAADFSEDDPRLVAQVDTVRGRTRPRTVLNVIGGIELMRESPHPVALQLGINNIFERLYLYNFHSAFSGTHVGRPARDRGPRRLPLVAS